jgi:ABC-type branched-subunit amino acid transport system substrate-binding protein
VAPADPEKKWATQFRSRFGEDPDYMAAAAWDAVQLTVRAITRAGLNRARIRSALQSAPPYQGASGPIQWNVFGRNERKLSVRTFTAQPRQQP